jgi:surfactin synthase thioesterase subunit
MPKGGLMTSALNLMSHVDGGRRYVCLPPAGGTLGTLREIAYAATGFAVWGVEYPARGKRVTEPPPATLEHLAEQVARELAELFGARWVTRTVLVGFSMGAFVGLELARRVHTRCGAAPATLVVVGAVAPQRRMPGKYARADAATLVRLLDQHSPTPVATSEARDYALELLRVDLMLASAYRGPADAAVPCPVVALCGEDDPTVDTVADATIAWRSWATGSFTAGVVRGDHLGLLAPGRGTEFWAWMSRLVAVGDD